jgi:hypothetical protein
MAIVIDQQPQKYTPVFNQSPWVVRETDTSGTLNDWRMLCRVISLTNGTVEVARFAIRFRENTERRVVFDPSEVLQGLISHDFEPMISTGPWMLAPKSLHWYVMNFQSQKLVAGVWVTQNQFTPASKCVWNAAIDAYVFPSYNQAGVVSSQNAPPKPLTEYTPNLAPIGSNDSYWVQFLSADEQAPLQCEITKYPLPDLQGTPLPADPVQVNPFGLAFTGFPSVGGNEFTRPSVRVGIGPRDLAAIASPISFVGVQSYRIRFTSTTSGPSTVLDFTFNINNCSKYTPTRLHWLNRLGGFDSWTFKMKSKTEEKNDRKNFYSQKNTLSGGVYGYDRMSRGTTDYHIGLSSEITLNSDLLTDAELEHLRHLVSSPVVFIDGGSAYDYLSVNVVDKSWTQKRGQQDGTFNLEIRIKPSMDGMRQRG